jgi:RNA polymerase sigma-70 factor (ECF subfamily)
MGRHGDRLSDISTSWTALRQAHAGEPGPAAAARQLLMERYGGAVRRYLRAALRDPHAADELTQEFALGLVSGALRHADPGRGRFRDYVKAALFHLVSKYRRRQRRQPSPLPAGAPEQAAPPEDPDRQFNEQWRARLLERAWQALAQAQPAGYAVLRFRAAHPKMPSAEMAPALAVRLGRPLTPEGVRQQLHRARDRFARLLLDAVADSLDEPTPEAVADELRELDLMAYCRPALERRSRGLRP